MVVSADSRLQCCTLALDSGLLVCGYLVAEVCKRLLALEYKALCLVLVVYLLTALLVLSSILLSLLYSLIDVIL